MTIISIQYDAKCKHCMYFKRKSKGKKVFHECNLTNEKLTLKSKICKEFNL